MPIAIASNVLRNTSYHAVYDESIMDALRSARDSGFSGIQVAAELERLSPCNLSEATLEEIATFCHTSGLSISVHGPDHAVSMFATNRQLRDGIWNYLADLFCACQRMGCELVTLHVGQMPSFGTATIPRLAVPPQDLPGLTVALHENLSKLVDLAGERFTICIENFGLNETAMQVLAPFLVSGSLSLCWDLPKSHQDERLERFLWDHLDFVRQVHLHDVSNGRSHQVLGTGSLDMHRYFPRIASSNVKSYCIEVRPREKAAESLRYLEQFLTALP